MLQVIDADGGGFAEPDRAEMARDFDALLVRLVDRGLQFGARDVHVRLERRNADGCPVIDQANGVFRAAELMHLRADRARAFEIRPGNEHVRTGHAAGVDKTLDVEIGVGFETSAGTRGGDAAR